MKFSIKDFFSKCDQIRSFLNGKHQFLCSVNHDWSGNFSLEMEGWPKRVVGGRMGGIGGSTRNWGVVIENVFIGNISKKRIFLQSGDSKYKTQNRIF